MTEILERRYRRLMSFYPAAYRRQRADEIIDTLLQGAADGQSRPTTRSSVALAVGGLRARSDVDRVVSVGANLRLALRLALIFYLAQGAFIRLYTIDGWLHMDNPYHAELADEVRRRAIYGVLSAILAVLVWFNRRISALVVCALIVGASFYIYCPGNSCGVDPADLVHPVGSWNLYVPDLATPIAALLVLVLSRSGDGRPPRIWCAIVAAYLIEQNILSFVPLPAAVIGAVYHVLLPLMLLAALFAWIPVDARPALAMAVLLTFTVIVSCVYGWINGLFVGPPWPVYQLVLAGVVGILIVMSNIRLRRQARV